MTRLTSRSDGRGRPLKDLVCGWAAGNPRIRRVWLSADPSRNAKRGYADISLLLELQPVGDSEETLATWMAHCNAWSREIQAELGEPVDLDWYDPDTERFTPPSPDEAKTLIYERAR
jgi:hypothetical protein